MSLRVLVDRPVELWRRYERHISVIGILTGFIFDLIVADRPDSINNNLYLLAYLFVAGGLIILLNLRSAKRRESEAPYQPLFLLFVLQFCFGGLASNMLVLYGRSGTFAGSALFFVILIALLIGNEFMRTRYAQLRFNIVVFYLLLFTYLIIAVPTFIFHSVGTLVFLASGITSIAIIAGFLWLVYVLVFRGREQEREAKLYEVSVLVGCVFVLFNGLYFLNIIPPVPLSLKGIGIYHSLERLPTPAGGEKSIYEATYEEPAWFVFWRDTSTTYSVRGSATASCFASVFAPTGLSAPIVHMWERYDEVGGRWVVASRTTFAISGGRDEGFRGFSDAVVSPGRWRCNVQTQNGTLIGRFAFKVVESSQTPALSQKTL